MPTFDNNQVGVWLGEGNVYLDEIGDVLKSYGVRVPLEYGSSDIADRLVTLIKRKGKRTSLTIEPGGTRYTLNRKGKPELTHEFHRTLDLDARSIGWDKPNHGYPLGPDYELILVGGAIIFKKLNDPIISREERRKGYDKNFLYFS